MEPSHVGRRVAVALAGVLALTALTACAAAPDAARQPSIGAPSSSAPTSAVSPTATPTPTRPAPSGDWRTGPTVAGFDVSRYNPKVNWAGLVASGHRFVYIKATEGTSHRSPTHAAQLAAAQRAGLFHGGYHYARPASSDGATQARFFTANGGAWRPDGHTLPGALDLEQSTKGARCHGMSVPQMQRWVRDFTATYARLNGRPPVIYVKAEVWRECVGNATDLGNHPLWLYDHEGGPDPLPAGWQRPTLWQRAIEDNLDRNVFFGTEAELAAWASGTHADAQPG